MIRFYLFLLACCALTSLQAQDSIVIPPDVTDESGFIFTYLDDFVEADTLANGEQAHSTYLLEAGGVYYFSKRVVWDFDVHFGATGDVENMGRPFVGRRSPSGTLNKPDAYRGSADISFDNLEIEMGYEAPGVNSYEVAFLRGGGDSVKYSFNNCLLYKVRQALARSEGQNESVFITNCHIYNLGDFGQFQGNGRLVSPRTGPVDSIVIKGNVIHNVLDRLYIGFRQASLNYFEFSGNTVFNHVGRHGFIQLNNTKESVIFNNFIQNPSIMGSAPSIADEQINTLGEQIYLFSLDTIVEGASITMSNNNINYTQDVLDHYASFDSVTKPNIYSPVFQQALTGDVADAHFEETLELNNVPDRQPLIDYAREAFLFRDSSGLTNIMVEDSTFAAFVPELMSTYTFDFIGGAFDPCYDPSSMSATASRDGNAVGAVGFCDQLTSTRSPVFNPALKLVAMPNPASEQLSITFETTHQGPVSVKLFDTTGKLVRNNYQSNLTPGEQRVDFNNLSNLPAGMYIARLRTQEGQMVVKVMKQ
ncbi:MAG: T9SS type A sorting domain-containing protein [Bacteroidota bacterium]